MKTRHTAARLDGWCVLLACSLLSAVAAAAEPAQQRAARDASACELLLEGKCIEKLSLVNELGLRKEITRPGPSVPLPPGKYRIEKVTLQGGYYTRPSTDGQQLLTLTPDTPCQLSIGAPLPHITAKRWGRLLTLDCQLRDADGRKYFSENRTNPPRFTIYQADRELASDSFEYG